MGTITVNIDDETEKLFRQAVSKTYGKNKGTLGRAIGEALENWTEAKMHANMRREARSMLKKGFNLNKAGSRFNRKDLYDEVIKHRTGY